MYFELLCDMKMLPLNIGKNNSNSTQTRVTKVPGNVGSSCQQNSKGRQPAALAADVQAAVAVAVASARQRKSTRGVSEARSG